MPCVILELGQHRQGTDLLEAQSAIGRGADNAIVIDHPTVSRVHAWLVVGSEVDGFVIRDTGSANGTYVDGQRVRGTHPLRDGALIRIGPARMTFRTRPLARVAAQLTSEHQPRKDSEGLLFGCECGARLWVTERRAGRNGTCPKCSRPLTYPIAQDLELLDAASAEATEPATMISTDEASSAPVQLCSICQCALSASSEKHACPACGLCFHAECWMENRGCSAYGCSQVNVLDADATEESALVVSAVDEAEAEGQPFVPQWVEPPPVQWEFLLLGASVVGSLLGLLAFGVPPLLVAACAALMAARRRGDPARRTGVVLACVGLGLIGCVIGVMISSWWWLGGKSP